MKGKYEVCTDVLAIEQYRKVFDEVLLLLARHGVKMVSLTFGWAWFGAGDDRDWTPFQTRLDEVRDAIRKVELEDPRRSFGHDDILIEVNTASLEINFSHERNIHLEFDDATSPMTSELLGLLRSASQRLLRKVDEYTWENMP